MRPEELLEQSLSQTFQQEKHKEAFGYIAPLISKEVGEAIKPHIEAIAQSIGEIKDSIANFKVESPTVNVTVPEIKSPEMPEIKLPNITIPEIKIPDITVNVPEVKLPTINVPEPRVTVNITDFPEYPSFPEFPSEFSLRGVGLDRPLPVQLRDADGKPFTFPAQTVVGGGGKHDFITIKGYGDSAFSQLQNADGRLKVDIGAVDLDISDSISVYQVSGASWSTNASQNGTWTVQPGNTPNTTPWLTGESHSFLNITSATSSTVVKSGAGVLHTITINTRGTGSTCQVFGDLVGEGSQIANIDTTLSTTAFLYDVAFTSGLTIVTTGASGANLTISYR